VLAGTRHRHQLRADHRRDQTVVVPTSHVPRDRRRCAAAPPPSERLERSSWFHRLRLDRAPPSAPRRRRCRPDALSSTSSETRPRPQ
jgi:hypothetical protein